MVDASIGALRARLAGAATASAPPPEPALALRQVGTLFMDVVGSTALARQLDPEAVRAVMDDALARGTAIVQAHHGKVLQDAGDNILAAFGADQAREDDAERAVQAGLALLALGKVQSLEVAARHGHTGFNVRVGIHTGGVLLGGGVDALIQSCLVRRAKPRSFRIGTRGIEGVATKMIARDAELEVRQLAFKRLFAVRALSSVTVVADAGIGKSGLLYEFEARSEARPERFLLFRGRANPQTGNQTFGLLRDILAWRLQIHDDDSVETARPKMEGAIVPLFAPDDGAELAEGHAHLLGHLIGIEWANSRHHRGILDDPKQIRNRAFHAAAQLFRRLGAAEGAPVALQLDDLHWADRESLDFPSYLAEVNREVPMLVLGFTRPSLFERRTQWTSTEGTHRRIHLMPLDERASRDLADALTAMSPSQGQRGCSMPRGRNSVAGGH